MSMNTKGMPAAVKVNVNQKKKPKRNNQELGRQGVRPPTGGEKTPIPTGQKELPKKRK